ncbi:gas vesicle protein GvpJ [Microbispora sp. NPDC049125]|uniref:gas vesicle protein GvpJ n=1 Tax=Microbispora sp. NPDC049125 TaxID=3154929 RepID=UPI0034670A02
MGRESANLGDILERVLDRGIVIAGDIRVNLLDIELLTIKLRLVIASVDTARELGIDWWEHDPWLSGKDHRLREENRRLRERLAAVEERLALDQPSGDVDDAYDEAYDEAYEPVEEPAETRPRGPGRRGGRDD